jgi:16S rRNA (uracil1498-N3)-methyltransferase
MQLFYTPDIIGREYDLNEVESKHAVRVLRLSKGDYLQLVDGKGNFYEAQIAEANPKKCRVSITKHFAEFEKRNHYLHLAVAPTKNIDRFEWFLEKATEIGVDEVTPILCSRSERKVVKDDRLEKVAIAAMKQSLKAYLPKVNPLVSFKDLIDTGFEGKKFIAHCYEQDKRELKNELANSSSILILIGPEGDFSEEEIKMATEKQFIPVSLGKSRLRTETAGVVACHTVNLVRG